MIINVHKNTIKKLIRLLDEALDADKTDAYQSFNNIYEVFKTLEHWAEWGY